MRLTMSSEHTLRLLFVFLIGLSRAIHLSSQGRTFLLTSSRNAAITRRSRFDGWYISMTSKSNNSAELRKCKDFSTSTNQLCPLGIRPNAYVIYKISCVLACAPYAAKFVLNCAGGAAAPVAKFFVPHLQHSVDGVLQPIEHKHLSYVRISIS